MRAESVQIYEDVNPDVFEAIRPRLIHNGERFAVYYGLKWGEVIALSQEVGRIYGGDYLMCDVMVTPAVMPGESVAVIWFREPSRKNLVVVHSA